MKKFVLIPALGFLALSVQAQTGNVGVGNSNPQTKLDVNGAITNREADAVTASGTSATIGTTLTASQYRINGTPTGTYTIAAPTQGTTGAALLAGARMVVYNNTAQNGTLNGFTVVAGQAVEFAWSNGGWRATNNGYQGAATSGNYAFLKSSDGTQASAPGDNSVNVYHLGGNVGIGTASPGSILTVQGDRSDEGQSVSTGQITIQGSNTNRRLNLGYNTTYNKGFIQAVEAGSIYTPLVLNALGGNVGVGTTSPGDRFVVKGGNATFANGNVVVDADNQNSNAYGGYVYALRFGSTGSGEGIASTRTGSPNLYGLDFYTSSNRRMSITGGGNIGINTATPNNALEIGSSGKLSFHNGSYTHSGMEIYGDLFYFRSNNGGSNLNQTNMVIHRTTGNVGIGDDSPTEAKLVVRGAGPFTGHGNNYSLNYSNLTINPSEPGLTYPSKWAVGGGANFAYSIYATNTIYTEASLIVGEQLRMLQNPVVASDARTKTILGLSSGASDLQAVKDIEITNYVLKDFVKFHNRMNKKIIAQQLEKVYPMAVDTTTGFIPDIYNPSQRITAKGNGMYELTLAKAHGLKKGMRVKLIDENEIKTVVEEVTGANSFVVKLDKAYDQLFVYGHEVDDFRAVDYDALTTLNISATQELARKVEALEKENTALKASVIKADQSASLIAALNEQVKELRQMMGLNPIPATPAVAKQ